MLMPSEAGVQACNRECFDGIPDPLLLARNPTPSCKLASQTLVTTFSGKPQLHPKANGLVAITTRLMTQAWFAEPFIM